MNKVLNGVWSGRVKYYDPTIDYDKDKTLRVSLPVEVEATNVESATEKILNIFYATHQNATQAEMYIEGDQKSPQPI